jgi:DNA-binding response OmpR family regulator
MPINETLTEKVDTTCLVLIADDDTPTRMLLHAAVSQWGYKTIEASDGEEAWKILEGPNPPRLLILDWLMPKLDGIALCERMKEKLSYHPYTILLTQLAGTTNITKALDAGADEFLSKPFNMAELHSRLTIGKRIVAYEDTLQAKNSQLEKYAQQPNSSETQKCSTAAIMSTPELLTLLEQIVARKGGKITVEKNSDDLRIAIQLPSESGNHK